MSEPEEKPKRTITPEHLERLRLAREKAQKAKREGMELTKIKNENKKLLDKQEKERLKQEQIELLLLICMQDKFKDFLIFQ